MDKLNFGDHMIILAQLMKELQLFVGVVSGRMSVVMVSAATMLN